VGRRNAFFPLFLALVASVVISCAPARERFVTIRYSPTAKGKQPVVEDVRITVNDFLDVREDRDRAGVDYTTAADIRLKEPVSVAVTQMVVEALKERGFSPITIKEKRDVADYVSEYEADYHLQGEVEELFVTVKRSGLLADFTARGRIFFRLFDKNGELLWSGRFSSEREVSAPFVSEKAIEEALSDCVSDIVSGFLEDEAVMRAMRKKD